VTSASQLDSSSSDVSSPRPRGFLRRHAVKLVASLVITCGVLYTARRGGLKLVPEGTDFKGVRWWTVAAYFAILLVMTWFRGIRWRFLLRSIAEVPKARVFAVSCVGFAAILLMPFRIGEIVRPYMIRTRPNQRRPGSRAITLTAAASSVIAERIVDALYLSIVLALALLFVPTIHPLPQKVVGIPVSVEHVRMSGYAMLGISCVAFATIAVFYGARSWAHKATLLVVGKISRPLAERLVTAFEKLADGLHIFGRGKDALGFFVETSAYWASNALGLWLLAWGSGVVHVDGSAATFGEACAIMGMVGCAVLVPGPPGLLGVFQAGIYAGMTMYYPTDMVVGPGAAYVFLVYGSQVILQVLLGGWGLWYEGGRRGLRGGLQALEDADRGVVAASADAQ
jgi:uncharacterized protein (TIRG00374 family)